MQLLLSKVKRSSCVCVCAMRELNVQLKLFVTSTFGEQGFQFRWKCDSLKVCERLGIA